MEINLVCVDEFCLSFGLSWLYCSGNIYRKRWDKYINSNGILKHGIWCSANVCLMCTKNCSQWNCSVIMILQGSIRISRDAKFSNFRRPLPMWPNSKSFSQKKFIAKPFFLLLSSVTYFLNDPKNLNYKIFHLPPSWHYQISWETLKFKLTAKTRKRFDFTFCFFPHC